MVASDTLVGVIGAVILLVALGGVFVFESRDTSVSKDFTVAETVVSAKDPSAITITTGTGTTPQQGLPCIPQPPATSCTNPSVQLKLTLGLPTVDVASKGTYVASITGAGKALVFGKLTASGTSFSIDQTKANTPAAGYDTVVVSYETTETPTAPSDLHLFEKKFTGSGDLKGDYRAKVTAAGSGKATLRDTDAGVQVDVTAHGLSNHTGYLYRVWLHTDGRDIGYTFVGTLTAGNTTFSGTVGGKASDYSHMFVTVEPKGFAPPKTASATGGPTALMLTLKAPASPNAR